MGGRLGKAILAAAPVRLCRFSTAPVKAAGSNKPKNSSALARKRRESQAGFAVACRKVLSYQGVRAISGNRGETPGGGLIFL
jgi:hypothetical protein